MELSTIPMKPNKAKPIGGNKKPTIASCLEAVLAHSDALMHAVIDGLLGSSERGVAGAIASGAQAPALEAAAKTLDAHRAAVVARFSSVLRGLLYQGLGVGHQISNISSLDELRLFDQTQGLDDSIELAQAEQELMLTLSKSLPQLDALISGLLGWVTIQARTNPLRPEVFATALRDALKEWVVDDSVRAKLIVPAAGRLGLALDKLYRRVIDWLLMHGVEPAGPTPNLSAHVATQQNGNVINSVVMKTMLTLDKLRNMLTGMSSEQLPSDSLGQRGSGFLHTVPLSLKAIEDGDMLTAMTERLERQAHDEASSLERRQAEARAALQSGKNIGHLLGREVVYTMLDKLIQDEHLLPETRHLLKQLEPSLLDVAESDARFFADDEHPARQFVSQIAERSLGFSSSHDAGCGIFLKGVQQAVHAVAAESANITDHTQLTDVYAIALHDLLDEWERQDSVVRAKAEASRQALLVAEQRNTEAQRLSLEFREWLQDSQVPPNIQDFITMVWSQVLAKAIVAGLRHDRNPRGFMDVVNDLVWSSQVGLAKTDKPRLLKMIPNLLAKLRQGAQLIDYPQERLSLLFDELLVLHEHALGSRASKGQVAELYRPSGLEGISGFSDSALHSGFLSDSPDSGFVSSQFPSWDAGPSAFIDIEQQEQHLRSLQAEVDSHLEEEVQESTLEGHDRVSPIDALRIEPGAWVELKIKGRWLRAQLTWQSPRKTMFAFVTASGTAHSMSASALETLLSSGKVRVISDGRMFSQAWNTAIGETVRNASQK